MNGVKEKRSLKNKKINREKRQEQRDLASSVIPNKGYFYPRGSRQNIVYLMSKNLIGARIAD